MTTIVDASVALKWVCDEEGSDRAVALLDGRPLAAPGLWLTEAANALWRRIQRGELTTGEAEERMATLAAAPVRTLDPADMNRAALGIAGDLGHPVYDCLYLVAALRLSARIVTADHRFHAVAVAHPSYGHLVRLL